MIYRRKQTIPSDYLIVIENRLIVGSLLNQSSEFLVTPNGIQSELVNRFCILQKLQMIGIKDACYLS